MRNFKGIIMSMYTSKLIIHVYCVVFSNLSMIHMPPKPIVSAGSDTSIIFYVRNEHFKPKYTPKLEYLVLFSQKNFQRNLFAP